MSKRVRPAVEPQFYSVDDLTVILGVCETTARHLVRDGELPSVRFGRVIRIPVAAVNDFLARTIAG